MAPACASSTSTPSAPSRPLPCPPFPAIAPSPARRTPAGAAATAIAPAPSRASAGRLSCRPDHDLRKWAPLFIGPGRRAPRRRRTRGQSTGSCRGWPSHRACRRTSHGCPRTAVDAGDLGITPPGWPGRRAPSAHADVSDAPPMRTLASERSRVPGPPTSITTSTPRAGGQPQHLALPVGMGLVVDAVVGADLFARASGVVAGGDDDLRAGGLANCSAKIETPPAQQQHGLAGLIPHFQQTVPRRDGAQGSDRGLGVTQAVGQLDDAVSSLTKRSVSAPPLSPAGAPDKEEGSGRRPCQSGKNSVATRSPTFRLRTSLPTATTSPAPSEQGTRPRGRQK